MTASNKQPVELNAPAGKNDDIIATSISEVLSPPQSPPKSILSKSASEDTPLSTVGSSAAPKPTPAQDKLTADIDTLTKTIEWHKSALVSGIDDNAEETRKKIKFLIDERESALKRKHRLQNEAERKKKGRKQKKQKVQELMERRLEIEAELSCLTTTERIGRHTHADNESLLHTITEIALMGCGTDDRRRSELVRSVRTVDDLVAELEKMGFLLSCTGMYLRLIPRRINSHQGKRHVTTVLVKLWRASNDKR